MRIKIIRRYVQAVTAVLYNCGFSGYLTGKIQNTPTKGVCVPGLNCYSCPGAVAACPLGALQTALTQSRYKLPWYMLGTVLLFGVLLGRTICGFLCPFGWLQELLHKIPTRKIRKSRITRVLSWGKYVVLALTLTLPIFLRSPVFCKYLCPAGTLEAGLPLTFLRPEYHALAGALFSWKTAVLIATVLAAIFAYRAFCRFLCPLGALYSLFSRIAFVGMKVDQHACTHCDRCMHVCKVDIRAVGDRECVSCTECIEVCPTGAISFGVRGEIRLHPNETKIS